MNTFLALIWAASTFIYIPSLVAGHEVPKMALTFFAASLALGWFALRPAPLYPSRSISAGWLIFTAVSMASFLLRSQSLALASCAIGCGFFIWGNALQDSERHTAKNWVLWLGFLHSLILASQLLWPAYWESSATGFVAQRSSGLVGNREFFASLVGTAILLKVPSGKSLARLRALDLLLTAWLVASLFIVGSKGTIVIVAVIWALPYLSDAWQYRRGKIALLATLLPISVCVLTITSGRARVLLWIVAGNVISSHWIMGGGLGSYGSEYFSALESVFTTHPSLAGKFGDMAGLVTDAHNLVLQWWAEAGLIGLAASAILLFGLVDTARKANAPELRAICVFFAAKLLYTVVVPSPTSLAVGAFAIGFSLKQDTPWIAGPRALFGLRALCASLVLSGTLLVTKKVSAEIHYSTGYRLLREQRLAEADQAFQRAIGISAAHADAWLGRAFVALESLPAQSPEPFLHNAITSREDFNVLKLSAKTFLMSGDCWNATQIYKRIITAYPQHLTSLANLAKCELQLGAPDKARAYASQLLLTQPRTPTKTYGANLLTAEEILIKTATHSNQQRETL